MNREEKKKPSSQYPFCKSPKPNYNSKFLLKISARGTGGEDEEAGREIEGIGRGNCALVKGWVLENCMTN